MTEAKKTEEVDQDAKSDSVDRKVQEYLKKTTKDYSGPVDGVNGNVTKQAIKKFQRRQNQYGRFNLPVDGVWSGHMRDHVKWVKEVQTEVAKWKASKRAGTLEVDGDYGHQTFTHVKRVQDVNGKPDGFYTKAGGKRADGVAGPKTTKMLGIKTHP